MHSCHSRPVCAHLSMSHPICAHLVCPIFAHLSCPIFAHLSCPIFAHLSVSCPICAHLSVSRPICAHLSVSRPIFAHLSVSLVQLFCHIHPLDTMASKTRSYLKSCQCPTTKEYRCFGSDARVVNLIAAISKLRYKGNGKSI